MNRACSVNSPRSFPFCRLSVERWTLSVLLFVFSLVAVSAAAPPTVFLLDGKALAASRERLKKGDATLALALTELKRDASNALKAGPFSVVNKDVTPPSGDKHDYVSMAPYFW